MLSRTLPKYRNIIPPIPSKQGIRYLQKLADLKGMINYINAENPNILPSHHTTPKLLLNITTNPELWTKQEYRTIPTTIFLIQLLLGKDWEHTNRAKGKELMQIISKRPAFTPYEYWYLLERIVYLPETIKDKPSSCRELFDMCIDMQDYPDNGSFTQHGEQHISEKNNKCFHGVALTTFSSSLNIQKYGIDPDRLSVHGDFQQGQDGGFYLSPSITFAMMFARRVADNMDPPIHTTGVAVKLSLEAFSYSELLNEPTFKSFKKGEYHQWANMVRAGWSGKQTDTHHNIVRGPLLLSTDLVEDERNASILVPFGEQLYFSKAMANKLNQKTIKSISGWYSECPEFYSQDILRAMLNLE